MAVLDVCEKQAGLSYLELELNIFVHLMTGPKSSLSLYHLCLTWCLSHQLCLSNFCELVPWATYGGFGEKLG